MSSDKNFLITLSIILIILFAIFRNYYFLYCSIGFTIVAYTKPNLLHLLNYFFKNWFFNHGNCSTNNF